ncbi:MAG: L-ribulose-5-phosphate 4-epimerase AraD [candidate division WOR-3 bacterium]
MLSELKERVFKSNLNLVKDNLVILSWGNVSGIDRDKELVVIKPSGIPYGEMKVSDMVVVNLDGEIVEGSNKPSIDTPTHLKLYRHFEDIGGIAHTHSKFATIFAQAGVEIPCLGTTHADSFYGAIPITRFLSEEETGKDYEENTAKVIIELFKEMNPLDMPGVLVRGHGPFTWGKTPEEAERNSFILENVAEMAFGTILLNPKSEILPEHILRKHYWRKHGPGAYYGQKK